MHTRCDLNLSSIHIANVQFCSVSCSPRLQSIYCSLCQTPLCRHSLRNYQYILLKLWPNSYLESNLSQIQLLVSTSGYAPWFASIGCDLYCRFHILIGWLIPISIGQREQVVTSHQWQVVTNQRLVPTLHTMHAWVHKFALGVLSSNQLMILYFSWLGIRLLSL